DVPHLKPVEVALNDVIALEREVGVDELEVSRVAGVDELLRRWSRRDQPQVPRRLGGIHPPGAKPDARVRLGRGDGQLELGRSARGAQRRNRERLDERT